MQQLTESFVKGVGKTAAALVVMGVVTGTVMGAMAIYEQTTTKKTQSKKNSKKESQETQTPLEMESLDTLQPESGDKLTEALEDDSKFKRIFDKFY